MSIGVSLLSDFFSGSADFSFFASTLLSEVLALTGAPGVEGAALAPAEMSNKNISINSSNHCM